MKAIFLDRDGVINELIYYSEHGIIDSPFTPEQFRLLPKVAKAITKFHKLGFKVIIASNQPGIAKGYLSEETFAEIRNKMEKDLAKEGVFLDGEYYCFHHPEAKVERLKVNCKCRKPEPGLLLKAAEDMDINLSQSWMIGDGLTDVRAGKSAGCRTILLGKMKCELCHLMDEQDARPDAIAPNLLQAAQKVEEVLSQEKSQVLSPKSNIRGRSHLNPGPRTSDIEPRTSDIGHRT
jgi:D-glycero-D-manno-heptose 1,7-bisphosphate phosphatase